jgi:hypothetical protein
MKFFIFILSLSFVTLLRSQSLVDNPCGLPGAGQLTIGAPCVNVTTAGLTPLFNPGGCNSTPNDDGWAFFYGTGGQLTVTFSNPSSDAVLHVFSASVVPTCTVTQIGCSDIIGTGAAGTESVTFNSVAGQLYFIRIQNWNSNNTITGCLNVVTPIGGCTNPSASNYNPAATFDDGTCTFPGADYVHPTVGGAGEFVGACLVNNCGPFTYTDNGGPSANYSNNIGTPGFGGIYRVFCPDQAGQCMRVTFNAFSTHNPIGTANDDYMTIGNGPTQNSPFFTTPPALGTGWITGTPAVPFSYTSTDASGCLTFRFFSNASTVAAGWNATLQCVPCAGGPNGTDNNDCSTLTALCAGTSFNANSTGPGLVSDGCEFGQCPAGGENFSNWYAFQIFTSGTLNITVTPQTISDDYDFAVYGPNVSCGNLGDAIRCSDAATTGVTGTGGDVDLSEPAAGNGQVATMNVIAGQTYIMVVDEWSPTGTGFNLTFSGTASLDCTVLPVELSEFNVEYAPDENVVDVFWKTASERDNDFWEVERSTDGVNWEVIQKVKGAGTTNYETQYYVADTDPFVGMNYYRLAQWDINGNGKNSEVRAVNVLDDMYDMLSLFPNPTNGVTEVIFNSYSKETAMLNVVNADGKTIVNTPIDCVQGGNRFNLDLSDYERGLYMISITTRDKVYRTKLLKE